LLHGKNPRKEESARRDLRGAVKAELRLVFAAGNQSNVDAAGGSGGFAAAARTMMW
jgi:hypothetical protein